MAIAATIMKATKKIVRNTSSHNDSESPSERYRLKLTVTVRMNGCAVPLSCSGA
jgi:hypothetical protein